MRILSTFALGVLLAGGSSLYGQQTSTMPADKQDQQTPADQDRVQPQDRDRTWNNKDQYHQDANQNRDRDRDHNLNNDQNGHYSDQDRERVNSYNQYNNGQNGTYSDETNRLPNQDRDQNEDYNNNRQGRDRQYDRDRDRDRTYNDNRLPQGDQDFASMSAAERSGFRAGVAAGRSDHQSGRGFSPNIRTDNYSGKGQDRLLYRQGFREGYERGYYGGSRDYDNGQYPR